MRASTPLRRGAWSLDVHAGRLREVGTATLHTWDATTANRTNHQLRSSAVHPGPQHPVNAMGSTAQENQRYKVRTLDRTTKVRPLSVQEKGHHGNEKFLNDSELMTASRRTHRPETYRRVPGTGRRGRPRICWPCWPRLPRPTHLRQTPANPAGGNRGMPATEYLLGPDSSRTRLSHA